MRRDQVCLGLLDPGHRDPPAVAVLRQAEVLPQLGARLQVLPGGLEVIPFSEHPTHAHVHVPRAPEHRL